MNLLEKFYYGELIPFEHPAHNYEEWKRLISQVVLDESVLLDGLNDEQKAKYKKYYESAARCHDKETCDFFVFGFRLGAQMMLEILRDDKPFCAAES